METKQNAINQHPQYEPIRNFLANLTDREKVLLSLGHTMLFSDESYLNDLWQSTTQRCFFDELGQIAASNNDKELQGVASLAMIMGAWTVKDN